MSVTCPKQPHNDPAYWLKQPAKKRTGYYRVTCKSCGKFIGYWAESFDTKQKHTQRQQRGIGQ